MKSRFILVFFIMMFSLVILYADSNDKKNNNNSLYDYIQEATVKIEIFDKTGTKLGTGSGFIVDSSGIIVTNNHVMKNAISAVVTLNNGDTYKDAIIRDFDEIKDIAIIKISGFDLPKVKLGNSKDLKGGEKVVVCGSSLGKFFNSLSEGIISSIRQSKKGFRYIQMSAPISHGNSGGPVFLENGDVVGMATASRDDGQNLNFAVPINYIIGMLENNKNMSLEQYSAICGQTMGTMIINDICDSPNNEQLVHPDTDISKRIVIIPFSGYCNFFPAIGREVVNAFVLRLKANYNKEELFIVNSYFVENGLRASMGDEYDSLLKSFDSKKAKEFAIKFRANTVIYGNVNHFEIVNSQKFIPFVGNVPCGRTVMNIDYCVYKLDQDKVILNKNLRRKQNDLSGREAILKIANVAVGEMIKKWKTFAASNKNGEKPIMIKIDDKGNANVVLK